MIVIDFSQLVFNNLYIVKKNFVKTRLVNTELNKSNLIKTYEKKEFNIEDSIQFIKHLVLNQILSHAKDFKDETEIVLAIDYSSWRKYEFQDSNGKVLYKAKRHASREDDGFDWETFWSEIGKFQDELKEHFPFVFVSTKYAEGDDVIGTLAEYIYERNITNNRNDSFVIISSDKDFVQLQRYKNVRQFSPTTRKEIKCVNPNNELMWLILKGDVADGIPNVKSPDDAFMTKNTVRMWNSTKIWEHIENNTVHDSLLITEELQKNFQRNKKLIDLRECPEKIKKEIIRSFEESRAALKTKSQLGLFNFLIKNKMKNLFDRMGDFKKFFNPIEEDSSKKNLNQFIKIKK